MIDFEKNRKENVTRIRIRVSYLVSGNDTQYSNKGSEFRRFTDLDAFDDILIDLILFSSLLSLSTFISLSNFEILKKAKPNEIFFRAYR